MKKIKHVMEPGKIYGCLKLLGETREMKNGNIRRLFVMHCVACNNVKLYEPYDVIHRTIVSCGCLRAKLSQMKQRAYKEESDPKAASARFKEEKAQLIANTLDGDLINLSPLVDYPTLVSL